MYGEKEWFDMQSTGSGWQDFLCANHSRNLHFDAFARGFKDYVVDVFGPSLKVAKRKRRPPTAKRKRRQLATYVTLT